MSDDFDDDLYNVYNGAGKEDTYNDEDLYGEDPVDAKEEFVDANSGNLDDFHQQDGEQQQREQEQDNDQPQLSDNIQQRQQQQQMKYMQQQQGGGNWGQQPNAYQQYMVAYQRSLQQQMAANPYQMQQMIQRQMSQHMPQQQHYNKPRQQQQSRDVTDGADKPIVASAANTDEG